MTRNVVLILLLLCSSAYAREMRFKDMTVEVKDGEKLRVAGFKGSVRFTPGTGANLTVRARKVVSDKASKELQSAFDDWSYTLRKDGNTWFLEELGPGGKSRWPEPMDGRVPDLQFEVVLPAMPVDVAWRSGEVELQSHKGSVQVMLVDGTFRSNKGEGALRVQIQKGQARVEGHRGKVRLDTHNAKFFVADLEGDLNLSNFVGESHIQGLKGNSQIRSQAGQTQVQKVTGVLDFDVQKGVLNIQDLTGTLRGQTEEANVTAQLLGDPEVNIESEQGAVALRLPAGSGSLVRLQSDEGVLGAPDSLRVSNLGTGKLVSGKMPGNGKGNVVVRSRTGAIRLR